MQADESVSRNGNCRCCLAKDVHGYNISGDGYVEMFRDCLNLFLNSDSRLSQLICSTCDIFLKDVRRFREMVVANEKHLLHHIDEGTVFVNVHAEAIQASTDVKQELADIKTEEDNDWDGSSSSTETFQATNCVEDSKDENVYKTEKECEQYNMQAFEEPKSPIAVMSKTKHESLKDNNKLRSNIQLILKYSTILPFTNNFKYKFKCFYCPKSYIPFKDLKKHIEIDHIEISEKSINKILRSLQNLIISADISCIKCKLCDEEFKTIDNLVEHLTNVHKKVYHETVKKPSHGILGFDLSSDAFKCHLCHKDFAFFKNLTVHMNEHYQSYVCYICGKKFLSEHRYKCHVSNTHDDNKKTKCKHCNKIFKTESSMAYHIKKEHLKRTIQCPQCPETFSFTHYIKRLNHMAVAHGIQKPVFKCDVCSKEYANSGSLAAHKRYTHRRTKEYRCEICGYITVHNTVMKNHMDVHNGVKNYECEFCKRKFTKPFTLKLHLKTHLNDKRFVCSLCDAAFIQKNSLKSHLKARHPDSSVDLSKL